MKRKKISLLALCLFVGSFFLPGQVDSFYLNLFNRAKALYVQGKYPEAAVKFKIAEFGLLSNREVLPELYLYYALNQFKQKKLDETGQLLAELKDALPKPDLSYSPVPAELKIDFIVMTGVMARVAGLDDPDSQTQLVAFETLFAEPFKNLDNLSPAEIKAFAGRLKSINKGDTRISFLDGLLAFKNGQYKDAVKLLRRVDTTVLQPFFRDRLYFYLALSAGSLPGPEADKECREFTAQIKDTELKTRLETELKKKRTS